jgi:hypothetical protein
LHPLLLSPIHSCRWSYWGTTNNVAILDKIKAHRDNRAYATFVHSPIVDGPDLSTASALEAPFLLGAVQDSISTDTVWDTDQVRLQFESRIFEVFVSCLRHAATSVVVVMTLSCFVFIMRTLYFVLIVAFPAKGFVALFFQVLSGIVQIDTGVSVTVLPGVTIGFDVGSSIIVRGELRAIGEAGNKITFTSIQAVKAAGDWQWIHFEDTSTDSAINVLGALDFELVRSGCVLEHAVLEYGGVTTAMVSASRAQPMITNVELSHSNTRGVYFTSTTPVFYYGASFIPEPLSYMFCLRKKVHFVD